MNATMSAGVKTRTNVTMNEPGFHLTRADDRTPIPFRGMRVEAALGLALAQVTLEQRFRNDSADTVEVHYTFPLAVAATLVSLEVVLGERVLRGEVHATAQAEKHYENALADGDGAFLLRRIRDGVFGISLGNLRPNEDSIIRLTYAEPHRPLGGRLRFRLPTVIAPHYGDPAHAGYREDDAPRTDIMASYDLAVRCTLEAGLEGARVASPTHRVGLRSDGSRMVVEVDAAEMDRDFVLDIKPPAGQPALRAFTFEDRTDAAHPRWGTLVVGVAPATSAARRARAVVILLDCSGSMKGDSMQQAKAGARAVIAALRREDEFAIVRFGDRADAWSSGLQRATDAARAEALARLASVDADLGGTRIDEGIRVARKVGGEGADLLLITDGEVNLRDAALTQMSRGGRIFSIGVGSAVSEAVVRELAERSGGACELVTPNEQMQEAIVRHGERMLASREAITLHVEGVGSPETYPASLALFAGDPMLSVVWSDARPSEVGLQIAGTGAQRVTTLTADAANARALLAVAGRLHYDALVASIAVESAAAVALRYGIVTKHTSMVAVDVRAADERAQELPRTVVVPQQMAAGWAGVGTVLAAHAAAAPDLTFSLAELSVPAVIRRNRQATIEALQSSGLDHLDIPTFLRKQADDVSPLPLEVRVLDAAVAWLASGQPLTTFEPEQKMRGVSPDEKRKMNELMVAIAVKLKLTGGDRAILVCAFIVSLAPHATSEDHRRLIEQAKASLPPATLVELQRDVVA